MQHDIMYSSRETISFTTMLLAHDVAVVSFLFNPAALQQQQRCNTLISGSSSSSASCIRSAVDTQHDVIGF